MRPKPEEDRVAQLTLKVNGYAYSVGCDDGQEPHLRAMAEQIESRVAGLKAMGGQSGEARLLLLTALMMADELHDMALERDERRPPVLQTCSRGPAPAPLYRRRC